MTQEFQMIAKTFKGLEDVLAEELTRLGANNIQKQRRAVSFTGDKCMLYKANLWLRTASRVLIPIKQFSAKDADEVYEQVKQIPWEDYMAVNGSFCIDSTVYSETFRHSKYVTYRTKDAIADRFVEREGKRPSVRVEGADLFLNVHIADNYVTVSLDSSGESLHRRGWRAGQTVAPLNEALAAGMLLLAGWNGQTDFYDPMCGSGTLLIEAAMIARNIPPGIYRQDFAFEKWRDFDKELFEQLYNDDSEEREFEHHIYGSDSGFYALQVAEKNRKNAGMQKYITLHQRQMQTMPKIENPSLIVLNPPYGERLLKDEKVLELYAQIGTTLKHQAEGSTAWIITSNDEAMKNIGLHISEKYRLMNGELDCLYVKYELFKGKRKDAVRGRTNAPSKNRTNAPSRNRTADQEKNRTTNRKYGKTTDRRLQLSSDRRANSKIPARGARPKSSAPVQKRFSKRG